MRFLVIMSVIGAIAPPIYMLVKLLLASSWHFWPFGLTLIALLLWLGVILIQKN